MQKKRILSAVIAAALSATMAVPAFAAAPTFSDVPASHWAYTAIEKAAGAKMVAVLETANTVLQAPRPGDSFLPC